MNLPEQLKTALSDRYIIEREIGAGGMATVYLARDVKHNRKVALKVLRPELGAVLGVDRFLSEIEVTANLQHPHLLPLFDSGEANGLLFYVMPFVQGESLRDRLDRERQLPVDEAVRIAVAVASALDYAHRHGVIHRDLKPENILLHDGQPLITDFGIALAITQAGGTRVTQTGLSLGTPQYMSPEQATGDRVIDARSDIYSLAAVLFEMLTGEPPHIGHTVQAIIAKVLTDRPQHVRHLRESVPVHVDAAIMRALSKLPADRFADASDFADALTGARAIALPTEANVAAYDVVAADPSSIRQRRLRHAVPWGIAALAAAVAAVTVTGPEAPAAAPLLIRVVLPDSVIPEQGAGVTLALSRDGSQLALVARGPAGRGIYLRPSNDDEARFVRGTEGGRYPHFSPDGRSLLFVAGQRFKRVPVSGGVPVTVTESRPGLDYASWSDRNEIVYGYGARIMRVSAEGGTPSVLAQIDSVNRYQRLGWPHALPGGKFALITIWKRRSRAGSFESSDAELGLVRLRDGRITELGVPGFNPRLVDGKYLVFGRSDGSVFGAPFSLRRLRFTGKAVPLLEGVVVKGDGALEIAVSDNGLLVYKSGSSLTGNLARVSRRGTATLIHGGADAFMFPRISPDGLRITVAARPLATARSDIWTLDLSSGGTLMRTTMEGRSDRPSWLKDGQRIAFVQSDSAAVQNPIVARAWDGTGSTDTLVAASADTANLDLVFGPPHGYNVIRRGPIGRPFDLWIAPADSPRALRPFLDTPTELASPSISPDGHLLAYVSDESGRREVYVQPLPGPGARRQVSLAGGDEPVWSPKGGELFYRAGDTFMSAIIAGRTELAVIRRDSLFPYSYLRSNARANYDVFPSGDAFVFVQRRQTRDDLIAIAGWTSDVRKRIADSRRAKSK